MKKALERVHKSVRKYSKKEILLLITILGFIFIGIFFIWISTFTLPNLDSFSERRVIESTKIYDASGEILLYDVNQETKRTVIPFEEISRYAKNATIAIEDREFYSHNGIKPKAIIRAVLANILSLEYNQGGSTITQQVIKNALLTKEKLLSRKIKEWVLALKLEKIISKEEILSIYLNEMPYGGALYGIEEASQAYFGVSARDINLPQSAYLAALLQAPSFYSPYGKNVDRLVERKNIVLREMLRNGFITEQEFKDASVEEVSFKPRETSGIKAPHFVFYVIEELEKEYGEETVRNGGLRVKTTLDYEKQIKGEEIAKRFAKDNKEKFNAENAAFVALDPKTGGILVMVGSRDYFDEEIDGNFNIATAKRQPGSTFKPFVYAQSFIKGFTPETVLFDVKTQFSTRCAPDNTTSENGCYSPENYDNLYRGPITLRNSLAQSINITSVKTLYLAGIRDSIRLAQNMGIESLGTPSQYGLTLVLGGGEVSLLEMVGAYSVFANEGVKNKSFAIQEVRDGSEKILFERKPEPTEILPREVALKISDILSDNEARAPAFGQSSYLFFGEKDVAVKTGTTNDYKDAWIIGYTPSIALGAWAGNNDNTPMEKKVAGFIVAPMWRAFMDELLQTLPRESFPTPLTESSLSLKPVLRGKWQGGISDKIDLVSKKRATEFTPEETTKEYLSGGVHSILHWVNKDDPRGEAPQNPENDPQYKYWEYGVSRWVSATGFVPEPIPPLPSDFDDVHTKENQPIVTLSKIEDSYFPDDTISITPLIVAKKPIQKAEFFFNERYLGEVKSVPFTKTFIAEDVGFVSGENRIRVVVVDDAYNKGEASGSIFIEDPQ